MPVQTTYPGVYIEELPSGVHTIVGVSTSVTAFVGAAAQGAANTPVRIFSVADFVRTFGQSIDQDHPLGYAVAHFFTNGGSEAVIVRVLGAGSAAAAVTLQSAEATPKNVLVLTASGAGAWANRLAGRGLDVTVDRAGSANPADLFNVVLTSWTIDPRTNASVVAAREEYLNLSMSPSHPRYVLTVVGASALVDPVARDAAADDDGQGQLGRRCRGREPAHDHRGEQPPERLGRLGPAAGRRAVPDRRCERRLGVEDDGRHRERAQEQRAAERGPRRDGVADGRRADDPVELDRDGLGGLRHAGLLERRVEGPPARAAPAAAPRSPAPPTSGRLRRPRPRRSPAGATAARSRRPTSCRRAARAGSTRSTSCCFPRFNLLCLPGVTSDDDAQVVERARLLPASSAAS